MKFRKFSTFFISILLTTFSAIASDTEVDGIYYNFDSVNKTASVTYKGDYYNSHDNEYSGDVIIPATVTYEGEEYKVIEIGHEAFENCDSLTCITISEGVTEIKEDAFYGCSSLTCITLLEGMIKIGRETFFECKSLTSITLPQGLTEIGGWAFYGCSSLTDVTIPEGVTKIEEGTFSNCEFLTNVEIPKSITTIGSAAFEYCSALTCITIPEGIEYIQSFAFWECKGLTYIISKSVTPPWCGNKVFYEVDKSTPIYVPMASVDAYKSAKEWSEFTNIIGVDFEGDKTTVAYILADEVVVRFKENTLEVEGVADYKVYSTSGINFGKSERLDKGVYVVVANGSSVKVMVK